MKFICTQENLKKGMAIVGRLAGKNQTLPILNNVLLEVGGTGLVLSTTNLEIGIKSNVRGKVEKEGSLTVPAKLLLNYIQNVKEEKVELVAEGNNLKIITSSSHTTIKGVDPSEFPLIPEIEKENNVEIKATDFKKGLSLVLFATALDTARPEISGVLFDFKEKTLVLAATDSYRLAESKININNLKKFNKKIIIPSFVLQEVNRILSEAEQLEEINISLNDNQVLFKVDSTIIISRLTEGEYPNYREVIPTSTKTEVELDRSEFYQNVRAASLFCRPGINDINLVFLADKLEIKALNDQLGESQVVIKTKTKGDENSIVFNYHYLMDVLSSLNSEKVLLKITDSSLPGVITPIGDDSYLYIIMPIKQ